MDTSKAYKLSAKRVDTGKWWGFGSLKHNPEYNTWRIGMKVTPELEQMVAANKGKYINFSLFEEGEKKDVKPDTQVDLDKLYEGQEIPF